MKTITLIYFTFLRALAALVDFRGDGIWFVLTFYRGKP